MSKKYIFPVFFFYIITSVLFLTLFSVLYYKEHKREIYENTFHNMELFVNVVEKIARFESIEVALNSQRKYDMVVFDPKQRKFLLAEFRPKKPEKYARKHYHFDDEFLYFRNDINFRADGKKVKLFVETRSNAHKQEISELKFKILLIVSFTLLAISIFAYLILRLSYLPLFNQIKALNNFIADTTHEINTPLSVILMSIEMFDKDPKKYLENIKISAKNMSELYSDLALNLKFQPNKITQINLTQLIKNKVQIFELPASNKNIKFELNLIDGVNLNSDEFKFGKIIDNLLSNAIKYSFKDEIIKINLTKNKFSVSDKGIVIKKREMNKIYDKFTRFDT
nr:HAMP domain-containing histidine kinase [Campylobacter sp.]